MKIEVTHDHRFLRCSKRETIRIIKRVLGRTGKTLKAVSVVYTNNGTMRSVNRRYLGHNFNTDVITFELERRPELETEIYINLDRARLQAAHYGQSYRDETARLLVHGLLHVLGFDDKSLRQRNRMRREEDMILEMLEKERT